MKAFSYQRSKSEAFYQKKKKGNSYARWRLLLCILILTHNLSDVILLSRHNDVQCATIQLKTILFFLQCKGSELETEVHIDLMQKIIQL